MARTKKITKAAVDEAVNHEQERLAMIKDFNRDNMGRYYIDPQKVPTDEDIASAKADFENSVKALQNKKDYVVADKDNALRVAKFLKKFISENMWTGRSFVGVINFCAQMDDFINGFDEKNPVNLELEYAPMQYAYLALENYGGIGLESAKKMAEMWDEYLPIYEKLHELVDWYNNEAHKCDNLKNRWAMFEQGYYMTILEDVDGEPTEEVTEEATPDTTEK
jgi:hypothetical protein